MKTTLETLPEEVKRLLVLEEKILNLLKQGPARLRLIAETVESTPGEVVKIMRGDKEKFFCPSQENCALNPVWQLPPEPFDLQRAVESLNEFMYGTPFPVFHSDGPFGAGRRCINSPEGWGTDDFFSSRAL